MSPVTFWRRPSEPTPLTGRLPRAHHRWLAPDHPGQRDAYLEACHVVVELARAAEGCLDFALSADPLDPDGLDVYERWASSTDLDRFRGSGPEPAQLAEVVDADVARYVIASVGPA